MKKLKIITIVGTRPEIIRLSRVISKLDKFTDHTLVHTGQNYDFTLNEIFFKDLNIRKPDYFLDSAKESMSPAHTIGNIIINIDKVLRKINPDAVLVLGDTNSSLSALPAKKLKIPIFHMEAGNRSFDQRVPEEINRKLVDHLSDINLTYSSISREYLIKEGIPSDRVIKTGSPMKEVINHYMPQIKKSKILDKLKLKKNSYYVISSHREENVDDKSNFKDLVDTINFLAEKDNMPIIFSTHPRTRKNIDQNKINFHKNINLIKPLGFTDYLKLQIDSYVVLSDSGTITEESSILNFRALNIRDAQERPEGFEEGSVMMVGLKKERVQQGLNILKFQNIRKKRDLNIVKDYDVDNVSEKVIRIITSYIDYVERVVWQKK